MFYILFLVLAFLAFETKLNKRTKFLIGTGLVILMTVIRYGIGADYFAYNYVYNMLNVNSIGDMLKSHQNIDLGFRFLIYFFRSIGLSYQFFVGVIGAFTIAVMCKYIYDNSSNPNLSLLLYYSMFYLVWGLSALRQGLVMSVGFYAFLSRDIKVKPLLAAVIIGILASFHISALIFIPIYLYRYFNLNLSRKTAIILLGISLGMTLLPLKAIFTSLSFLPILNRLLHYLNEQTFGFWNFAGLVRLLFAVTILFFYKELKARSKYTSLLTDIVLLGFIAYFFLKFSETIAGRMTVFTFILTTVLFVDLFEIVRVKKFMQLATHVAMAVFCGLFLAKELNTVRSQSGLLYETRYTPFQTIYSKNNSVISNRYLTLMTMLNEGAAEKSFFEKEYLYTTLNREHYSGNENAVAVYSKKISAYILLNTNGNQIDSIFSRTKFKVMGELLYHYDTTSEEGEVINPDLALEEDTDGNISKVTDFQGNVVSQSKIQLNYEYINKQKELYSQHITESITIEELPPYILDTIGTTSTLTDIKISKYTAPVEYNVMEFMFSGSKFYFLLDTDMNFISKSWNKTITPFNENRILEVQTPHGVKYYNDEFKMIYYQ